MELAFAKTKTVGINFDYDIWINVVFADDNFYPIVHEALFNQSEPRLDGKVFHQHHPFHHLKYSKKIKGKMEVSIIINLASSQEQIIYWMVSRSDVPILTTGQQTSDLLPRMFY